MQRPNTWLGSGLMVVLLILGSVAHADEEKVRLDRVPKPVMEAVKSRFKEARATGAAKETEDGKLVYEVTIKNRGQHIDVTLIPEGEILMIEKEIAARELPSAVASALGDKYPRAKYKIVEEIFKVENKQEKLAYYEVLLVTTGKKTVEVQVTAEGKIVNVEEKRGPDKDDK